jgi:Zn-finger nucleic acid-binding protein
MDCPRDNVEMSELSDGEERIFYRCDECGGLWLDVADLNRILLHAGLPTLEAMGGRANPEEDAGDCPVDLVDLLAVQSLHKRNPLTYETCESCGGIWLESADFAGEGETPAELTEGIVDFFREFSAAKVQTSMR